jgi:hypothetical protein
MRPKPSLFIPQNVKLLYVCAELVLYSLMHPPKVKSFHVDF